jgi:hypothetical protein
VSDKYNILNTQENKMKAKEFIPAKKPRNFVAKNAQSSGAGRHSDNDKKKNQEQGKVKYKKDLIPMEGGSNAIANTASRLVNKDDGKVAKLRAAGDKRREDQLKSRNIAKKNEDAASVAESDPSGLMHAARHLNKEFRITAEVDGVAKRARVQAQSSRTAQEKFMKRYPTAQIHNVEDITQQMSETGVAEGGFFDPDRPNIGNVVKHKHSGAMGRVKKIGTQGDTTTVYFKDAKTGAMNYGEWKKHVFPIKKQGVAEGSFGSGYGRVFTLYVNTGEKPPTKTKTKKFKREDDAVAWAEDYADRYDQYPNLKMEIKDENGGVVWELAESQGVAEGGVDTGGGVRQWANQVRKDHGADVKFRNRQEGGGAVDSIIARNSQGEIVGVFNRKTNYPTVYEPKKGVTESGMTEVTGDNPFDNMMKKVTTTPTAKARNTERILQKKQREEETRDRLKGGFGPSPADKLSIRKSSL